MSLYHADYIIIGDVHGCLQELHLLLHLHGAGRKVVFVGDLVNKGPRSREVVELAMVLNAQRVMGNHEDQHIRFHRHEQVRRETGKKNPMNKSREFRKTNLDLSLSHLPIFKWLEDSPAFLEIPEYNLVVLHGGLLPGKTPAAMDPKTICRVRQIRPDGKMAPLNECEAHPEYPFWTELYTGHQHVVYGHNPFDEPRISDTSFVSPGKTTHHVRTYGIDTGCVYGGKLSALLLPEWEVVSVPARMQYAPRREHE